MHIGIDLGTSNSSIAAFDGQQVSIISNGLGENLTPSVVRIDGRGVVAVGRPAQRFLDSDPGNTHAEFKRLMGSAEKLTFDAARRELAPEELSAHVLRSLLADARDSLGFAPRAAVISTPALFELPQNHATVEAGKRAGLEEVALIQEPIASAIAAGWCAEAAGLWLVFDLGGGTLDVSLLETKDARLRVVDHSGDNFLGGKDFDAALVDWAVARLKEQRDLATLDRANPACRRAFSKLKAACEQAKIDLSRQEQAAIVVPELCLDGGGAPVDVDLAVSRTDFVALVQPLLRRCLSVCEALLSRARVPADDVARVVLVGGPTLTPEVRRVVGRAFGDRLAEGIDPMTVVARGAALFAATVGLDARPKQSVAVQHLGLDLRLEYPPVTADLEPYVVGRFLPTAEAGAPQRVYIERSDGGFRSATIAVPAENTFVLQVKLGKHAQNHFRVVGLDASDHEVALGHPDFAIVHGLSVADPPLSRSVGLALADDSASVYLAKGTPLPARRTLVHNTVRSVTAGTSEDVLSIPVVQGEYHRAHRNRLIGRLEVRDVKRDLPMGSRVEVTLELDRSGQIRARAHIPAIGETFEDVIHVLVPAASLETLTSELSQVQVRAEDVRRRGFVTGNVGAVRQLAALDETLAEARRCLAAASGGDADSAQKLHRSLLEANATLDSAEEELEWPELSQEADDQIEIAMSWIAHWATPAEHRLFERALELLEQARHDGDAAEVDRQIKVIRSLGQAAYVRYPGWMENELEWCESRLSEAIDVARATQLVARGRKELELGGGDALKSTVRALHELFPGTAEERRRSFGSGLR